MINRLYYFMMICAYVLATLGGFGYAAWGGSWLIALAILALAFMAWPKFMEYNNKLME